MKKLQQNNNTTAIGQWPNDDRGLTERWKNNDRTMTDLGQDGNCYYDDDDDDEDDEDYVHCDCLLLSQNKATTPILWVEHS